MMSGDINRLREGIPQDILTKVEKFLEPFHLSDEKLKDISTRLEKSMNEGLGEQTHDEAFMLPTFVRDTPNKTEEGDFLGIDLGGTNLRVLHIHVEPGQPIKTTSTGKNPIPKEIMEGTGEKLFDYIATRLGEFLKSQNLKEQTLPLGFSFSFPFEPKKIDESILLAWSKGFKCSDVVGKDLVKLLIDAIEGKKEYKIGPVAMVNDTVGTMMSCAYNDKNCVIGMVLGTGTNACYMEERKNVEGDHGRMCINTEWGGFGDDGSLEDIRTECDEEVDKGSANIGKHKFEKMISGMYLGEVVRLVLVKLTKDKLLFKGQTSEALLTKEKFKTKFISEIEEQDNGLKNTQRILTDLGLDWDEVDARVVRLVCDTISSRSARLCAAALATIANRIRVNQGLDQITVAVDGTVYKKHPNIEKKLQDAVRVLAPQCKIIFHKEDDSGVGAALVAAVEKRLARQQLRGQ